MRRTALLCAAMAYFAAAHGKQCGSCPGSPFTSLRGSGVVWLGGSPSVQVMRFPRDASWNDTAVRLVDFNRTANTFLFRSSPPNSTDGMHSEPPVRIRGAAGAQLGSPTIA